MKKYNKITKISVYIIILIFVLTGSLFTQKNPKDKFSFPPLKKIEVPKIQKTKLDNGMIIYLVEDHELPTICMRAMIRTGSIYNPVEKIGLSELAATVLRTGGTKSRTGDEIDKILETMRSTIETGSDHGAGYVYLSVLKEDIDKALELMADNLMNPAFQQEKIDLAKIEAKSVISRRNDNVGNIANREFNNIIYGKTSPYSRMPEYATIDAITREDILAVYEKTFHPNSAIFAVWGDFNTKELQKKIENVFKEWKEKKINLPSLQKVQYQHKYTINFVQKNDINQSNIQMGHIGGLISDVDNPVLVIMSQILSYERMYKVIRSQDGLTYSPWGYYGADFDHPGIFSCGAQTKSHSTVYAKRLMMKEVKRICEEEVSDEELARAKDSYLNSYIFNFDSKAKIVNRFLKYAFYGYPLDFMDIFKSKIEKITKSDILNVAKKHLHPDELQILVVGKKEDFDEPLSVLGKVNEIDFTIPVVKIEVPKATPENLGKGKEIINHMAEKIGGKEKIRNLKSIKSIIKLTQITPMGDVSMDGVVSVVFPHKISMLLKTPGGEVSMTLSGEKAWLNISHNTQFSMECL